MWNNISTMFLRTFSTNLTYLWKITLGCFVQVKIFMCTLETVRENDFNVLWYSIICGKIVFCYSLFLICQVRVTGFFYRWPTIHVPITNPFLHYNRSIFWVWFIYIGCLRKNHLLRNHGWIIDYLKLKLIESQCCRYYLPS